GMRAMTGREFDHIADREGLVIVYPDGFDKHWNGCRGTADYVANTENIDDVGFLARVIDELAARYGIDKSRVYITGISNGGHMAYRAALEAPGLFAAHAPVAASLPAPSTFGCSESGEPAAIAIFNGTGDPVNPYTGGAVSIMGNTSRGVVRSSEETAQYWRELAGLTGPGRSVTHPETDGDSATQVIEQRWGEPGSLEIRHYTLQGSGHTMPSQVARMPVPLGALLGGNAGDISGPEEIVAFFLGHSLDDPAQVR
ncbi:MAG: prolyl oligopeptidase family serine peptidase, partial [Halioglobus sp.]|nr:prolyl oligopeptidase family serine peptidase [Halioglobus sp.]